MTSDKPKKGGLLLAIGLGKKPKADDAAEDRDEDTSGDEGDSDAAFTEAAGEAFDALKADDREAFCSALQAAILACQSED